MATKKTPAPTAKFVGVDALKHPDDKRRNTPPAEYQSLMTDEARKPVQVSPRPTQTACGPKTAAQHRPRPATCLAGKDAQDWTDLVVNAPPLYIQEKVHPKALIDDLQQQTRVRREGAVGAAMDMFGDFNGTPAGADKTDFYAHGQNWSNRMILGGGLDAAHSMGGKPGWSP